MGVVKVVGVLGVVAKDCCVENDWFFLFEWGVFWDGDPDIIAIGVLQKMMGIFFLLQCVLGWRIQTSAKTQDFGFLQLLMALA